MMRNRKQPSATELAKLTQLFQQGLLAEAEQLSRALMQRFPEHGVAWKVLGVICLENKQFEEALRVTNQATHLLPDDASVYNNLGTILQRLERFEEAELNFRKALAMAPDYAKALFNLAGVLRFNGQLNESEVCCRHAIKIDPHYTNAHIALGNALELQNRLPEAQASYKEALKLSPDLAALHTDLLHLQCLDVGIEPQQLLAEHLAFGKHFESSLRANWPIHPNTRDPDRNLQIGFVSGDFYNHALANFLEPLFKFLALKSRLTLHIYDANTQNDEVTQRLRAILPRWNSVHSLNDDALAQKIQSDEIDILIDLSGHTVLNRLLAFARKPAPIQASWLGYLGTTGLQAMDYYVCDPFWIPPGELDWQFVEKPAYLPNAVVFQPNPNAPPVNELPALSNGHITFGSFNRHNKINDAVVVLWSQLLHSVPHSKIVLGAIGLEHQDRLVEQFQQVGIRSDRLSFFPRTTQTDYLALHHQVDFCLDTFPHGGGATTAHAAWMGVPTLCLAGQGPASRFGATEMHHLGLDGFIAYSIEEFIERGHHWAGRVDELSSIRQTLRARFNGSPLGQPKYFADNFETLLRTMWSRWCAHSPVAPLVIEVQPLAARTSTQAPIGEPSPHDQALLTYLYQQHRYVEAESLAKSLTEDAPEHGLAWKILASTLHQLGRLEESLDLHKKIVELRPDDHEAHFNLASEFHQQGDLDAAVKSYIQALGLQPDNAIAYSNLGNILKQSGLSAQSEIYCRQAIALDPNMTNAHNNLGNALHGQGKFAEAEASYRRALVLAPHRAETHNNLAITLKDQGCWQEAKDGFQRALQIKPDWAAAHSNLLYCLSHDVQTSPKELHAMHMAFGERFETPLRTHWLTATNTKDPQRRLNVGFVSADFYDHALTNFLEPVFKALASKSDLVLHAYYTHIYEDAVTHRMRSSFSHWHAVAGLTDADLAVQIRADGIDILIDLTGHTAHNRLLTFARKPAPIQASWLGYLGTTGLQAMDYYLCDTFWVPPGILDWQLSEKAVYLPAAMVFQPSKQAPAVNTLPAMCNGHITFGSFNRPNKLNQSVIVLWSMLLKQLPQARMLLAGIPRDSEEILLRHFVQEGIDVERLDFHPRSNLTDYLALHHKVDFCLDAFPFGGGATSAHAAWMGVPTLSLAGETLPSRFGSAIMHQLGLDGFIAIDIDDFIAKGVYWSENLDELANIRTGMRARFDESSLGQADRFVDHLGVALRAMWQRWCIDLPAASIHIDPRLADKPPSTALSANTTEEHQLEALISLYNDKRYQEAELAAKQMVASFPASGLAWKTLGAVYQAQERYEESINPTKRATELLPADASNFNNLGLVFMLLQRPEVAQAHFEKAIALEPDYGKAYVNLGTLWQIQGDLEQAQACCHRALTIDPGDASAHVCMGKVLEMQGLISEAQASYYRADMAHEQRRAVAHSNVLYLLNHDVLVAPNHLFAEHKAFGQQFEIPLRQYWKGHDNAIDPLRLLQIGFVSGDFHHHALNEFLEPVFKLLGSRKTLTLHAFSTQDKDDEVTLRLKKCFAHWHDVAHLSDEDLANKIRRENIDILLDLSGHTARNRLLAFARKPAPVQVSWLGYLGTTGLQAMDYYICDTYWIPENGSDGEFVEKMAYLPSAVTFQANALAPSVSLLPALKSGHITFASFNRPNKINTSVISLWSMLLRSVPSSVLLIVAVTPESQAVLSQIFQREGISSERLFFYPRLPTEIYLALHQEVDICLDTYPHAGGATTANAAWMGVPTLGLSGQTPASRFSATLMHQLGLDDFVASSVEEFVHIGRYWSQHITELAQLRGSMRQRFSASMLGNPEVFTDAFEAMLREMWQGWCDGTAVQNIDIQDDSNCVVNLPGRVEPLPTESPSVLIVSASKLSESAFWTQSALGLSLMRLWEQDEKISVNITFNNSRGLPEIFNTAIENANDDDILVFIHDDVWIDEYHFTETVAAGLQQFDVIGVAGNKRRLPHQPAWCFVDHMFTWDDKSQLSGCVGHGEHAFGQLGDFGVAPAECELLDGVFLATKKSRLTEKDVRFDTQFDFHFYDMDFCRSAKATGLKLGTWHISLTHQSGGSFGTRHWQERYQQYFSKWEKNDLNNAHSNPTDFNSTMPLPLVSIVIPTHNRPDYLEIALNSALNQTYENVEIVISDNSDDSLTQKRIAPYLIAHKNIKYFRKKGMSAADNWKKCFELSNGAYVNYLMDDDIFHPEKIKRMMHYYLSNPDIGLVTSLRQLIDEQGNHLSQSSGFEQLFPIDTLVAGPSFGHTMLTNDINLIGEPTTVLLRRADVGAVFGTFHGRHYTVLGDVATWLSVLATRDFVYISEPLSYFRIHSEQDQRNSNTQIRGALEWFGLFFDAYKNKQFLKDPSEFQELLAKKLRNLSGYVTTKHEDIRKNNYMLDDIYNVLAQGFQMLLEKPKNK